MNETHDASVKSWVESANRVDSDFPVQNLPYGVFRSGGREPSIGIAIGDQIFDAGAWVRSAEGRGAGLPLLAEPKLNSFLGAGREVWSKARSTFFQLLRAEAPQRESAARYLVPQANAEMLLPVEIGDYTDFYASVYHATNVGSMFRPQSPLLPNYKWVPIGYHGRASSIVVSGTEVRRPCGQIKPADREEPILAASRQLDYELEVGAIVGPGNELGRPISLREVGKHMFGLCLVNDWSARDVQAWEYQPLGPFLAKNFTTTISPWLVTMDALEPFRTTAFARPEGDPTPLPYLFDVDDQARGGVEFTLEVYLATAAMREQKTDAVRLSRGNFRDMYWTLGQLLAHHTSNGCNLQPGDLLASGTVSGQEKESRGCLLELTWRGSEPLQLPGGETRKFLEDGDEVVFRAFAEKPGFARIGFGECRGVVVPALP
jgi:fumarylacetoacetase